ncbi:MAG: sugar phosphate isomerase/epimerase [Methanoregula sp.]|uniref:sugar phosphate isomerase/epimerase family protein n=1 Tax=Methanoregula sp. TaxID=2052170 RepID=UPI0025E12FB1|nr:sugar phosphate isomerase/epimerase family protein [Methanoregula sp.]MCK9632652.1 sugar phosphate isomerase/epimerase [Methanoregula sp.]
MTHPLYISTFCRMDYPLNTALATLSERTTHVEILADGLHDILAGTSACTEYPFSYSVHAPTSDINIASVYERMRQASVAVLDDTMAACTRIGADHLVIHPGYAPYEQVRARSCAALHRSLDDLARLQDEHGVRACVENMGMWECCHFRGPKFIMELAARDLGCTLDVGHAQLNGNLGAFLAVGGFCHVHLHDNHGTNDDHAACGDGLIDFPAVMQQLPGDATLVIETKELDAADRSCSYLTPLMNGES